ncbi:MAG TPA: YitT family protein [Burkholderiaceae bacterium]|nr:YitT family protein [Burkholderiaceae bacterium]
MADTAAAQMRHTKAEDVLAILIGSLFVSFGIVMFNQAGLLTGGTAGLAFLIHYASGIAFGPIFFVINLPFYVLAFKRMGTQFTVKTFCAVGLVSLFSGLHPQFVQFDVLEPFYAAVIGGLLIGTGILILFRHRASLGGVNILALYLQDRHGIRAGKLQMSVDVAIVLASLLLVSFSALLASVLGAIALNLVIALNHRPGRYMAV